jgi:hypothetical protein
MQAQNDARKWGAFDGIVKQKMYKNVQAVVPACVQAPGVHKKIIKK